MTSRSDCRLHNCRCVITKDHTIHRCIHGFNWSHEPDNRPPVRSRHDQAIPQADPTQATTSQSSATARGAQAPHQSVGLSVISRLRWYLLTRRLPRGFVVRITDRRPFTNDDAWGPTLGETLNSQDARREW
jgi:hypothetical protein